MDYIIRGSWLLVSCFSDQPQDEVFAAACDVARDHGALPEPYAIALPRGINYDFLFYVHDQQRELTTLADAERVAAGRDPQLYAAQAYFRHPRFGLLMVDRSSRFGYGKHAIAIVMESDLLGVPDDMWHGKDRKRAVRIGAWLTEVLSDLTARTDALYGGVSEEGILCVPEELVAVRRFPATPLCHRVSWQSNRKWLSGSTTSTRRVVSVHGSTALSTLTGHLSCRTAALRRMTPSGR